MSKAQTQTSKRKHEERDEHYSPSKKKRKQETSSSKKRKHDGSNSKAKPDPKKSKKDEKDDDTLSSDDDTLDDEEFSLPSDLPRINWLDLITLDSTVSIFGKRNTGKSFYARYLLYLLKDYLPWGWCLTNTPHNGWWQQMIPEKRIFHGWRPDVIKGIVEDQKKRIRRTDINPFVFIILDDIVSDNALRYDATLRELYYEGRHYGIFILICAQYVYGLPPGNRANTDFMVTFNQHQHRQIKQIQEDYCTEYKNWQYLRKDFQKLLGDHECIIVNQRDPDLRGVERYYIDVADEPPPFYMGTKNYWEGSDWEQQCKDWAPILDRTLEKMKKMKTEMEYKHTIDDSRFEEGPSESESPILTRIMDYGGHIPYYF
jgi:hypothetical protein